MDKKVFHQALLLSLVISLIFFAGSYYVPLSSMFSFPFGQIAAGLRQLSLSSPVGNVLSLVLYGVLSLSPVLIYLYIKRKRKTENEDALLILLSLMLFITLYLMINPAHLGRHFGAFGLEEVYMGFCGVVLYSILGAYLGLRLLRRFSSSDEKGLQKHLKFLILLLAMSCVFAVVGIGLFQLKEAIFTLEKANQGAENLGPILFEGETSVIASSNPLMMSYLFLILQFIVNYLPTALTLVVLYKSFELILEIEKDPYGLSVGERAKSLSDFSKITVVIILFVQMAVNLLQFAFGSMVRSSQFTLSFPFTSLVMVLLALLFAKYFEKIRVLKEDVDSFI